MDFVEVPSHLMEYFAWDEAVLATFAKHHRTNEPVPPQLLHDMRSNKNRFAAMDMQTQVVIGMYDQVRSAGVPSVSLPVGTSET
jgi:intermediate peptidase